MIEDILYVLVGGVLLVAGTFIGAFMQADYQNKPLADCARKYNVYECELVAIPKGSNWLLPPPAEGE